MCAGSGLCMYLADLIVTSWQLWLTVHCLSMLLEGYCCICIWGRLDAGQCMGSCNSMSCGLGTVGACMTGGSESTLG